MSKRAEEAALKAYPKEIRDKNGIVIDIGHPQWIRDYYIEGYEQAQKDKLHKAEKWLAEMHRVCDITDENGYRIELRDLTASLEKAMEEE